MPDPSHLTAAITSLQQELVSAREAAERERRNLAAAELEFKQAREWAQRLEGALEALNALAHEGPATHLSMDQWILALLQQARAPLSDREILDSMIHGGWVTRSTDPLNNLRAVLSRLLADRQIERTGRATYALPNFTERAPHGSGGQLNEGGDT
jgi:multidrug resistance efflux pump